MHIADCIIGSDYFCAKKKNNKYILLLLQPNISVCSMFVGALHCTIGYYKCLFICASCMTIIKKNSTDEITNQGENEAMMDLIASHILIYYIITKNTVHVKIHFMLNPNSPLTTEVPLFSMQQINITRLREYTFLNHDRLFIKSE